MPVSKKVPAKVAVAKSTATLPAAVASDKQTKLIDILKTDHKYDVIKEIIEHIQMLKRAKKIKPLEKHRMLINYNLPCCPTVFPR